MGDANYDVIGGGSDVIKVSNSDVIKGSDVVNSNNDTTSSGNVSDVQSLVDIDKDEYIELLLKLIALERQDVERGETMLECLKRLRGDMRRFFQFYSKQESKIQSVL